MSCLLSNFPSSFKCKGLGQDDKNLILGQEAENSNPEIPKH